MKVRSDDELLVILSSNIDASAEAIGAAKSTPIKAGAKGRKIFENIIGSPLLERREAIGFGGARKLSDLTVAEKSVGANT